MASGQQQLSLTATSLKGTSRVRNFKRRSENRQGKLKPAVNGAGAKGSKYDGMRVHFGASTSHSKQQASRKGRETYRDSTKGWQPMSSYMELWTDCTGMWACAPRAVRHDQGQLLPQHVPLSTFAEREGVVWELRLRAHRLLKEEDNDGRRCTRGMWQPLAAGSCSPAKYNLMRHMRIHTGKYRNPFNRAATPHTLLSRATTSIARVISLTAGKNGRVTSRKVIKSSTRAALFVSYTSKQGSYLRTRKSQGKRVEEGNLYPLHHEMFRVSTNLESLGNLEKSGNRDPSGKVREFLKNLASSLTATTRSTEAFSAGLTLEERFTLEPPPTDVHHRASTQMNKYVLINSRGIAVFYGSQTCPNHSHRCGTVLRSLCMWHREICSSKTLCYVDIASECLHQLRAIKAAQEQHDLPYFFGMSLVQQLRLLNPHQQSAHSLTGLWCTDFCCSWVNSKICNPMAAASCLAKHFHIQHNARQSLSVSLQDRLHSCQQCTYVTLDKSAMDTHLKKHPVRPVQCRLCPAAFTCKSKLASHMRTHTGERPFSCVHCNASFSSRSTLNTHISTHTKERPFSCVQCNASFSLKRILLSHMQTHATDRPFFCKQCNASFKHKSNVYVHMRSHKGVRPFSCAHCNATFTQKHDLVRHIRIHTGERPFSCELCNASFITKYYLVQHMRTHTGERPFSCVHCNATFSQKSTLNGHLRCHTGERPHSCVYCNASFSRKYHLTMHVISLHGKKS
ncbi:hypothetical protein HPB51_023726 [Rhipicephalus microplus]|uniref:C2H2-type domain-containing protein n=1 Tax=Rhipicephalus microplus TaxID=6941 RepID=A0A9J6E4C8_RHIMP|nr:hypothetical protein HPB51_023726 [Rhipicephalus microplus]